MTLARPWTESHLNLVVKAFAHTNAVMRRAGLTVTHSVSGWPMLVATMHPTNLKSYIRSYEEMITQTEERERANMARLDAGGAFDCVDWISAALDPRIVGVVRAAGAL